MVEVDFSADTVMNSERQNGNQDGIAYDYVLESHL